MLDLRHIGDVDKWGTVEQRVRTRIVARRQTLSQALGPYFGVSVRCHRPESFAVIKRQASVRRSAKPMRFLQYRIEHGNEIARRAIDDLQHIAGCGLIFERLLEIACTLL